MDEDGILDIKFPVAGREARQALIKAKVCPDCGGPLFGSFDGWRCHRCPCEAITERTRHA